MTGEPTSDLVADATPPVADARLGQGPPGDTTPPVLSFVIPAFNEERFIGRTLQSIHDVVPPLSYEVIVVDNRSTDATPRIAAEMGATVITHGGATIGAQRNRGVQAARGAILVFLDADVVLTRQWAERVPAAIALLNEEPTALTGFRCSVPEDASWLERYWFQPRETKGTHVGSGHMLVARRFFQELDGFDESLATGEDYNFSRRAVAQGGRIASDEMLRAVHLGFPRTVKAFVQRESWHGIGDYESLSLFLRSKVALSTAAFVLLHVAVLGAVIMGIGWAAAAAIAGIVALCLFSSYRQYRSQSIHLILVNAGVFWLYYLGRALAFVRRMAGRYSRGSR